MMLSRHRHGACVALQWEKSSHAPSGDKYDSDPGGARAGDRDEGSNRGGRYACGALNDPIRWLPALRGLPQTWVRILVRRWIAAGAGCDADFEAQPVRR
jgi:hypothetical protein